MLRFAYLFQHRGGKMHKFRHYRDKIGSRFYIVSVFLVFAVYGYMFYIYLYATDH